MRNTSCLAGERSGLETQFQVGQRTPQVVGGRFLSRSGRKSWVKVRAKLKYLGGLAVTLAIDAARKCGVSPQQLGETKTVRWEHVLSGDLATG
jgi:hypothetical protein